MHSDSKNNARILIIAPQPFFSKRGTPFNIKAMIEVLTSNSYQVDLLTSHLGKDIEIENLRIYRSLNIPFIKYLPIGISFSKIVVDFFILLKAITMIPGNRYDVVHGIEEGGFIAWFFSKFSRAKLVFDMDSCMPSALSQSAFVKIPFIFSVFTYLEKKLIKSADAVLTVCSSLTNRVLRINVEEAVFQIEDCPLPETKIVDDTLVDQIKENHKNDDKSLFVYTGNLEKYQGVELIYDSVLFIKKSYPELAKKIKVLIVGGGNKNDEIVLQHKKRVEKMGISKCFSFLGLKPVKEMGSYMQAADILISPRIDGDNTPLKIYSYMESGTPILATNIYSHSQVLNKSNAVLVEPNPHSFAQGMLKTLSNESEDLARLEKISKNARRDVRKNYSYEAFGEKLKAMYDYLLSIFPYMLLDFENIAFFL